MERITLESGPVKVGSLKVYRTSHGRLIMFPGTPNAHQELMNFINERKNQLEEQKIKGSKRALKD